MFLTDMLFGFFVGVITLLAVVLVIFLMIAVGLIVSLVFVIVAHAAWSWLRT